MMFNSTVDSLFQEKYKVSSNLQYREVSRDTLCIPLVKYGDNVDWFLIQFYKYRYNIDNFLNNTKTYYHRFFGDWDNSLFVPFD